MINGEALLISRLALMYEEDIGADPSPPWYDGSSSNGCSAGERYTRSMPKASRLERKAIRTDLLCRTLRVGKRQLRRRDVEPDSMLLRCVARTMTEL
jgi:hypothetical protein